MMVNHKVALRYATSLLESSLEKNSLDSVSGDVEFTYDTIQGSAEFLRMLHNPVIKTEIKLSIISEIFKGKVGDELINFMKFVIEKGRDEQLVNILQKFKELKDEHLGIVNIVVHTAFQFSAEQTDKLKEKFEDRLNKKVQIKFIIDKNVIGGFVAKVNDTVYDASVRHQLELLKKEFLGGGISLN